MTKLKNGQEHPEPYDTEDSYLNEPYDTEDSYLNEVYFRKDNERVYEYTELDGY